MSEEPRPSRWRRALWIGLAVALVLAAATPLVLPLILEAGLSRAVDRLAARHGLDVRWARADVRRDGLTLTDVEVTAAAGRARIAEARIEVSLWAALTGEVRIAEVELIEPELNLGRLDPLPPAMPSGMPSDDSGVPSDDSGMPSGAFGMPFDEPFEMPSPLGRLLARLDGQPLPPVRFIRPAATLRRAGGLYRFTADGLDLTPLDGRWQIAGRGGVVELMGRRLTGQVLSGRVAPDGLSLGAETAPGTRIDVGPARIMVERLILAVGPRFAELRAERVDAAVGGATAEGLTLVARWSDRLRLSAADGGLRVPPSLTGISAQQAADIDPAGAGDRSPLAALERLAWRLPPVRAEGLSVELPGLPPLLEVAGDWHGGRLDGRAVLAGGEVRFAADVDPGRRVPHSLRAELRGVRLAPLFARRLPPEPPRRPRRRTRADGVLDGQVTLAVIDGIGGEALGQATTLIDGRLAWREGRIELSGLADVPVDGIELELAGELVWQPAADHVRFAGRAAQGPLAVVGEGTIADALGDPRVRLQARGEPIDCAEAFAAIPAGLWGPYDRAELSGELAPTFRLDWPVHRPQTLELKIRKLFKACAIETLNAREAPAATVDGRPAPGLDDVGWLETRFVLPVREGVSDGAEVQVGPGVAGYVPLGHLPRYVGATMYQSEEMNFWRNNAIDRGLLVRALRIDLAAGRFVYGGSTVTQQLVKNLFLTRRKTLARKLQELLVATRITQAISRERVLELYLNCIEFGRDVYGIGPASRYYFQKNARSLTPREAVFLAMLKPAPRRGTYYRRRGHGPTHGWWVERAGILMQRLVENGQISAQAAEAERPYGIEWVDKRYVPSSRHTPPGGAALEPDTPDAPPPPPPPPPPPFGGSRLIIER